MTFVILYAFALGIVGIAFQFKRTLEKWEVSAERILLSNASNENEWVKIIWILSEIWTNLKWSTQYNTIEYE